MSRLDVYLVENSLAPSRTKAQEMIQSGGVEVSVETQFQVVRKPSFKITSDSRVRLVGTELLKYVARSGLKLEYAMNELGVSPKSKRVLDIGLSTGGFAHCLLEHEASEVVGVDVGRDQLHPQLKNHPRLSSYEGVNARYLREQLDCQHGFDMVTVDVSFISLEYIFPEIPHFLVSGGELLSLVKPQFEWGQELKGGGDIYGKVKKKVTELCESINLNVESYITSQLPGRSGDREFFIYGKFKH